MSPQGRVAVVSGAASGIGSACAAELTARGWQVAGLDLKPAAGVALALVVDMTDGEAVSLAVRRCARELGDIDAVVSVAGTYEMLAFEQISATAWNQMLRLHLGGLLNLARAAVPDMVRRGGGSVIGISSELAVGGGDNDAHYAAAKGAVIGLVRSLAVELAGTGVRVNAVAPGPTDTPMIGLDSPWRAPAYLATLPARSLVTPQEIALTVAFLIEEGTSFCGEVVSPNAGAVL